MLSEADITLLAFALPAALTAKFSNAVAIIYMLYGLSMAVNFSLSYDNIPAYLGVWVSMLAMAGLGSYFMGD
jgi:hypothetical protein